jgi:hypothetical protein
METPERDATEAAATPEEMERRQFVRRISSDAVGIAGRVFGLSKALNRGVMAGGQAMRDNLEAVALGQAADEGSGEQVSVDSSVVESVVADPAAAESAAPGAPMPPQPLPVAAAPAQAAAPRAAAAPPVRITEAHRSILVAATSAVLAVNGRESAPIAVPVPMHWDGETIRFASLGWSRRAGAIRTDPRVTLVVESVDSGSFLTIEGRAEFIVGAGVRAAMGPLLSRVGDDAEADGRWAELVAADADRVVVIVTPEKVLLGKL